MTSAVPQVCVVVLYNSMFACAVACVRVCTKQIRSVCAPRLYIKMQIRRRNTRARAIYTCTIITIITIHAYGIMGARIIFNRRAGTRMILIFFYYLLLLLSRVCVCVRVDSESVGIRRRHGTLATPSPGHLPTTAGKPTRTCYGGDGRDDTGFWITFHFSNIFFYIM